MTDVEKPQQMSGLPQSGTAQLQRLPAGRQHAARHQGVLLPRRSARREPERQQRQQERLLDGVPGGDRARRRLRRSTLEYHIGQAIGDEMLASGNTMMLAPTINILRHPAWGRAQETYGEDVFLLGRLGSAFVSRRAAVRRRLRQALRRQQHRERPRDRERHDGRADAARDLRAPLRDDRSRRAASPAIMAAYNQWVNGTEHSTQSAHLLTDLLRTDFGFQGFVLSRLVGDAERQQRPVSGDQHAAADRRCRRSRPASIWSCPGDTTTRR